MTDTRRQITKSITVVLASGERIDVTGLTADAVIALLRERGIRAADIKTTEHVVGPADR
jgi:hypothetical protein